MAMMSMPNPLRLFRPDIAQLNAAHRIDRYGAAVGRVLRLASQLDRLTWRT
jgi:hypothetical protein